MFRMFGTTGRTPTTQSKIKKDESRLMAALLHYICVLKMGNPQSTGSSGGDGELICRRPHKRRQSRSF